MTPAQAEIAGQIERAYPGYHVWTSDEGHWYAVRTSTRATGPALTVEGADPDQLTRQLAAEQTAAARAHQAALTAPAGVPEPPPIPVGWPGARPHRRRTRLFIE